MYATEIKRCCLLCHRTRNGIETQLITYTVLLESPYTQKETRRYFICIITIHFVNWILGITLHNPWIQIINEIIAIIGLVALLLICNSVSFKHSLSHFYALYRIYHIVIAIIGICVMNDFWYQKFGFNSINISCYIISVLWSLIAALNITLLALINDGYNVDLKFKMIYHITVIIGFGYYLIKFFLHDSDKEISFFSTEYKISWRSVTLVSLFTVVVFIFQQMVQLIRKPNQFTTIICYVPVIGIENAYRQGVGLLTGTRLQTSQMPTPVLVPVGTNRTHNTRQSNIHITSNISSGVNTNTHSTYTAGDTYTIASSTGPLSSIDTYKTVKFMREQRTKTNESSKSAMVATTNNGKGKNTIELFNMNSMNISMPYLVGGNSNRSDGFGLSLLNLGKNTMYKDTFDLIDAAGQQQPIYLNKDYTLWFVILHKIFKLDIQTSLKYNTILTKNRGIQVFLALIILVYFVHYLLISHHTFSYACTVNVPQGILYFLTSIAIVAIFLMINVDYCVYLLQTRFSIYWRIYDTLMARLCALYIHYINGTCNQHSTTGLLFTMLWESIFVGIVGTMIVSMMQSYLNVHFGIQCTIVAVLGVAFWAQMSVVYVLSDQSANVGFQVFDVYYYSIDLNDYVVVKCLDASLWFAWQLFVMIKHRNHVRVTNATRKWIVIKNNA